MTKEKKSTRINILIECLNCNLNKYKRTKGISRYITSKNRKKTIEKLELFKYCKFCNLHTRHKEIK